MMIAIFELIITMLFNKLCVGAEVAGSIEAAMVETTARDF